MGEPSTQGDPCPRRKSALAWKPDHPICASAVAYAPEPDIPDSVSKPPGSTLMSHSRPAGYSGRRRADIRNGLLPDAAVVSANTVKRMMI
jgi:hypothetical protein